jgi:ribonuclease P protein component
MPERQSGARVDRLKRRAEFLRVAGSGRKWAAPGLVLQACPTVSAPAAPGRPEAGPPGSSRTDAAAPSGPRPADARPAGLRYGLTVSRKVGGAVVRNRVRRRLRAVAEAILPAHAAPGHDYVLIGRAATATRPFVALQEDLTTALRRVKAYRE